jgi:uncharacterized membrane protein
MRASTLWRIDCALLALHAAGAALAWFRLPPRVPVHFGFTGAPDAWAGTSVVSWFAPLAISAALSGLIRALATSGPLGAWNIPEKQRFLRLTPEQRAPVLELLHAFAAAAAVCATVVFLALHVDVYVAAKGAPEAGYAGLVMFGAPGCLLLALVPWSRAVKRAILRPSGSR